MGESACCTTSSSSSAPPYLGQQELAEGVLHGERQSAVRGSLRHGVKHQVRDLADLVPGQRGEHDDLVQAVGGRNVTSSDKKKTRFKVESTVNVLFTIKL